MALKAIQETKPGFVFVGGDKNSPVFFATKGIKPIFAES